MMMAVVMVEVMMVKNGSEDDGDLRCRSCIAVLVVMMIVVEDGSGSDNDSSGCGTWL